MSRSLPETYGAPVDAASLIVYGVHGRGQSPEFIRSLADRVGVLEQVCGLEQVHWVMPAASGDSWYPQGFMVPPEENQPHLDEALGAVTADLDDLAVASAAPIVVLGFSQGACLLAEYLLTARPAVHGIILHTGGYLGPEVRTFASEPRYAGIPAAVLTAREDSWVPLHRCEETAQALESIGADVTVSIFEDTEHHINDEAIGQIRALLSRVTRTAGAAGSR